MTDAYSQTDGTDRMTGDQWMALPQAPLAMPKQMLEAPRVGFLAGLMARFAALTARSQG